MYISGVNYESIADGLGLRTVVYISGCKHNCIGCHNKESQCFTYGIECTEDLIHKIYSQIQCRPFLNGLTLSGGDPFESAKEAIDFLDKMIIPKNNLWIYTGYTFEELSNSNDKYKKSLLKKATILVDGKFEHTLRDIRLPFVGSSNQRIINVQQSLDYNKVIIEKI